MSTFSNAVLRHRTIDACLRDTSRKYTLLDLINACTAAIKEKYGSKVGAKYKVSVRSIQLDLQMPQRFDLTYVGADGEKHRPVMIHRVAYGSIERFIGILIEHFAGAFPTWLAPVQAVIIPVSEAHKEYAYEVQKQLDAAGVRVKVDDRNEKMGYRIRENQLQKVPYMLVVGDKEIADGAVAVRARKENLEGPMPVAEFIDYIVNEIKERRL